MASSRLPNLLYWTPQPDTTVDSLTPTITVSWSTDMATGLLYNDETRPNYIQLIDTQTSTIKDLTYYSYESLNTYQNQPYTFSFLASSLDAGREYQVNIFGGWKDVLGRTSAAIRTWTFLTPSGSLSQGTPISPSNESVQSTYPGFTWASQTGTGTYYYQLQVDTNPKFNTLVYNVSGLTVNYYTPDTAPTENLTYYWRIRTYTSETTGAWSDVKSFYYGTVQSAHEDSRITYENSTFGLLSTTHTNGMSHRYTWPTFSWTFTSTPASGFSSHVEAVYTSSLITNSATGQWRETSLPGTWSLSGDVITFTPTAINPSNNTKYIFRFKKTLTNTAGVKLTKEIVNYFVGEYQPFYTDPALLRANLRSEYDLLDEDYINFQIHLASKLAQLKYLSKDYSTSWNPADPNSFLWSTTNQVNLTDMATFFWVEARARVNIIRSVLNDLIRKIGTKVDIADFSKTYSKDTLAALQEAEKKAMEDLDYFESILSGGSGMQSWGAINSTWSEANWYYDFQIGDVDGRRKVRF